MPPKKIEFEVKVSDRNPYIEIQNPVKAFVPIEDRVNREITLTPIDTTLAKLVGWDQEGSDWMKEIKKASPNHRRNRTKTKLARKANLVRRQTR